MTLRNLSNKEIESFIIDAFAWTPNLKQKVGIAVDATNSKGSRIEIKADKASTLSRNFFIEYAQTFDSWANSTRSGIALATQQADFICFVTQGYILMVGTSFLKGWLGRFTGALEHRVTGKGANGNKGSSYAVGCLVPVGNVVMMARKAYTCTNAFTDEWEIVEVKDLAKFKEEKGSPYPTPRLAIGWAVNPFEV